MTGAMYAAIAGLRTHMQNLNVIGNNVANVNTYGYKSARSVFKTAIYTNLSGGSDGTDVLGGANPSQIGYGANMGSIGIDMSTGNYAITGMTTDLMLDGDGFFVLSDKTTAGRFTGTGTDQSILDGMNLTRVGNFQFGPDGYLAREDDGMCVYGFLCTGYDPATGAAIFSDQLVPIRVPGVRINAKGDPELVYPAQLDATGQNADPNGELQDPTQEVQVTDAAGNTSTVRQPYTKTLLEAITFDRNTGVITAKSKDTKELITIGVVAVGNVKNPNGVTNMGDNYFQAGKGSGGLSISLLGGAAETLRIPYMNQSLRDDTGNDTAISDVCRLRDGGETGLLSNGLEMSKTDLAQEISQMILTQRGYQANTRVVTVTDSMLEELVNMKR